MTDDHVADLADALARTLESRTAGISWVVDFRFPDPPGPRRRRGGVMRRVSTAARPMLAPVKRRLFPQPTEGRIDFEARRYTLEGASLSITFEEGQTWWIHGGHRTPAPPFAERFGPIWLLDLLGAAMTATAEGTETVRGVRCRRYAARADLAWASGQRPEGMASPSVDRFEDLRELPVAAWIDDAHVRRIRFDAEHRAHTLELFDFGA